LWVVAISDEDEVREKLLLTQIPCEAQFEPLSAEELGQLELEPGEVRRIWLPTTASPTVETVIDELGDPKPKPEEHVSPSAESNLAVEASRRKHLKTLGVMQIGCRVIQTTTF
jgi:hypothetical protein